MSTIILFLPELEVDDSQHLAITEQIACYYQAMPAMNLKHGKVYVNNVVAMFKSCR